MGTSGPPNDNPKEVALATYASEALECRASKLELLLYVAGSSHTQNKSTHKENLK